jgi:hypothetical protein
MIGADDILDDLHWTNVQEPIRQMFLSITKAIRAQAAGIRDLDRKSTDFITNESAQRLVKDYCALCCSKKEATELIHQIETRVSEKSFYSLESKLFQVFIPYHFYFYFIFTSILTNIIFFRLIGN